MKAFLIVAFVVFANIYLAFSNDCAYFPSYSSSNYSSSNYSNNYTSNYTSNYNSSSSSSIAYVKCDDDCCTGKPTNADDACCYYSGNKNRQTTWWVVFLAVPAFVLLIVFIVLLVCLCNKYKAHKTSVGDMSKLLPNQPHSNGLAFNPYSLKLPPLGTDVSRSYEISDEKDDLNAPPTYLSQFERQPTTLNFQSDSVVPVLPAPNVVSDLQADKPYKKLPPISSN